MKTSRIIFITFFSVVGFIFLSLLILGFAFNDKSFNRAADKYINENIELEDFSHIFVESNCKVNIKSGSNNHLSFTSLKEKKYIKPEFNIQNDTLYIIDTKTNVNYPISLSTTNIKTLTGNNDNFILSKFSQDSLNIQLIGGRIFIQQSVSLGKLELKLESQANCTGSNFTINSLKLTSNNSKFQPGIKNKLDIVEVEGLNHSEVILPQSLKYNLNLDETSKIRVY